MNQNNYNPEGILAFSIRRNITNLFKECLVILENLEEDHNEAISKLEKTLPEEYQKQLYLADHFTQEKMEQLRKRILSKGNDTMRTLMEELNRYDIEFKK